MKQANLSNSIYQRQGSGPGQTIKDGMLINNGMDGMTGIAQACAVKKANKMAQKIETMSTAMRIANGGF